MGKRWMAGAAALVLVAAGGLPASSSAAGGPQAARVRAAGAVLRLGDRVLAIGMHGADVFHLQVLLTKRGYPVQEDGAFGPQTRAAVERFQGAYGLVVDGVVGPITLAALRSGSRPAAGGGGSACSSTPGTGDAVTRWRPVVLCVLGMLGQPQSSAYAYDVLLVIRYESGGNPEAINLWDINAHPRDPGKRPDPTRGLMQVTGANFEAYRSARLPDDIYNPAANIYAGLAYATAVYGSIPRIPGVESVLAGRGYVPYKLTRDRYARRSRGAPAGR